MGEAFCVTFSPSLSKPTISSTQCKILLLYLCAIKEEKVIFPPLLISACNLIKAAVGERTFLVHNCLSAANQKMDYMCKIKHTQKVQKFVCGVFSLQATSCLL